MIAEPILRVGRRSSTFIMAILFFFVCLLMTHASAAGWTMPTSSPDQQIFSADNAEQVSIVPVLDHPQLVSVRHGGRHFWHWWHKQQRQTELHHQSELRGRSRRAKQVPNGEDNEDGHHKTTTIYHEETTRSMLAVENRSNPQEKEGNHGDEDSSHNGIHVASWRWDEIGIYITFTTFIIVAGLAKVGNESPLLPPYYIDRKSRPFTI